MMQSLAFWRWSGAGLRALRGTAGQSWAWGAPAGATRGTHLRSQRGHAWGRTEGLSHARPCIACVQSVCTGATQKTLPHHQARSPAGGEQHNSDTHREAQLLPILPCGLLLTLPLQLRLAVPLLLQIKNRCSGQQRITMPVRTPNLSSARRACSMSVEASLSTGGNT